MSPALDLADGLRRCFGKRALLHRLLDRFLATQHDMPERMEAALAAGDVARAADDAHRMVSNAGTIGATELSRLSALVDELLRDGQVGQAAALLPRLRQSHAAVCEAVRAAHGTTNPGEHP